MMSWSRSRVAASAARTSISTGARCHWPAPPVVLGHEIVGTVAAYGRDVRDLDLGQTVCLDPIIPCGKCGFCQNGKTNLCPDMLVLGYHLTGGFAEYTVAPRRNVYPISASAGVRGGVIVEPLACVLNGYDRLAPAAGSAILILGAGPIGLIWTQLLANSPVTTIVQTDKVKFRCEQARKLGANTVLHVPDDDLREFVGDTRPDGFDAVIDVTGNPEAVEEGVRYVKPGGTFMLFGVCPEGSRWNIDPYEVFARELRIVGAKMPPRTLDRAVSLVESGRIDYQTIISHEYSLVRLEEAFTLFSEGHDKVLKMAIRPV